MPRKRTIRLLASLIFVSGLFIGSRPAASSEPMPQTVNAQANAPAVTISNFKFEPKELTVTAGSTVTWTNKGGTHTVTADDDSFSSPNLKSGDTFTHQFTKAGKYPYHCSYHGSKGGGDMAGTIIVKAKAAGGAKKKG